MGTASYNQLEREGGREGEDGIERKKERERGKERRKE